MMLEILDFEVPSPKTFRMIFNGMRNSWESQTKSDSVWNEEDGSFQLSQQDKTLALKLIKAGSSHGKFMRQLQVIMDIQASSAFWAQYSTYKVGTTENSTSRMHILGKKPFDASMFDFECPESDYVQAYLTTMNELRDRWIAAGKRKATPEWRAMIDMCAESWIYVRTCSTNYQVLRAQYHDRKHHRLDDWHVFCRWIEELPYSFLITEER